ncbi:MAG: hypothetical protein KGJ09_10325 [Candidatus Omnitrophica bacterium]|nr:hypothetical protein [Candidatus Omnitrophota bacterium]MDE2215473.1 hypothetical protein [Candidatus Omnitrophota bacterium]
MNTIEIYRDDSTTKIVLENVKHYFWTADNTVLVIAQYVGTNGDHQYIHWPRERICWFRHVKNEARKTKRTVKR